MKKIEVFFIMSILMILSIGHYSAAQKISKEDNYPVNINKYEFLQYSGGQAVFSLKMSLRQIITGKYYWRA